MPLNQPNQPSQPQQRPLLEARNITKHFPGTLALSNAQVELLPGEIHAVMGENGAGKSTLMKILSGVYTADSGEIYFQGQPITLTSPREALMLGIAIVHQELSVVPTLTVGENIFPGHLPTNLFGMVNYRQLFRDARQALAKTVGIDLNPRTVVETLSIANQQLIEITRALSSDCKVLILDEPTSALTDTESDQLLALLKRLAAEGVGILYISHKLKEIFAVADRVTVLRDGHYIGTERVKDITHDHVIRMMVGRELGTMYPNKSSKIDDTLFEVRDLRLPGSSVKNSFKLHRGEVLGFAGLIGSGRSELARAIFGADPKAEGEIFLNGTRLNIPSPGRAIELGIGYLPEDRKAAGLFLEMSVKLNVAAAVLEEVSSGGFVAPAKESALARHYVKQLNISTPGIEQEIRRLSGGNQQKTLVAKWLSIKPKILIVDEPTRGIDVGAKKEIHFLLRELAESGVGVIMISSELPEILGMSDRILVMHEGAIVAEFDATAATEEQIIRAASAAVAGAV
ncbi:MAG TPA: sugar ABC transporter ATP-binding protein [Phototrophicaceae bacterium]|jgi:ribose transport system ATP-binding protein|nr:sugar ABC transporter ATP-binding protein [Phototrophicaceae bacterium]